MEMNINIGVIAAWIGAISTIIGTGALTYRTIVKHFDRHLDEKIAPVVKWNEKQQTDINLAAERDALMMEAQIVSLEAIHEGRNNGNVTGAIDKLRQYILKQSIKPSSYSKK